MVNEYTDNEKDFLDNTCSRLRIAQIGTNIQELQQKINANENISLNYNNNTGILRILIDNVEKANVNLGLEKYVAQASIVTNPQGQPNGKYIKLQFEGGASDIFIPVDDIGKIYTAGTGINISPSGVISCTLDLSNYVTNNELADVAFTGSYNDLIDKPSFLHKQLIDDYIIGLDSADCNLTTPLWVDKTGNYSCTLSNTAGLSKETDGGLRFLGNTANCIINTNMPQSVLSSSDFTIEIVNKFDSDGMNQYRGILGFSSGSDGVEIGAFGGSNYNVIGGTPPLSLNKSLLSSDTYIHQVITRSGSTIKCYINNVLVATGTLSLNFNYNNFIIGRSYSHEDAYTRRFKGVIRHINIFNRALSLLEVKINHDYYLGGVSNEN